MEEVPNSALESLALAVEVHTSKYIKEGDNGTDLYSGIKALEEVQDYLNKMAKMYQLDKTYSKVFCSFLLHQIEAIPTDLLLDYMNFMQQDLPKQLFEKGDQKEIALFVYIYHVKRMQRWRQQRYIASVFFGIPENREALRPEIFHEPDEDNQIMTEEEILSNHPSTYYFQVGNLSLGKMMEELSFADVMHLYFVLNVEKKYADFQGQFPVTTETSHEEMCLMTIEKWKSAGLDPRTYLTFSGPMMLTLAENHEFQISLCHEKAIDMAALQQSCAIEHIPVMTKNGTKSPAILMEEYVISQLSYAFTSTYGDHRNKMSALEYDDDLKGVSFEETDEDEMVFFGLRDGMSKMIGYKIEDLYHTFKLPTESNEMAGTGYCFDPISVLIEEEVVSWRHFPIRTIKRLMTSVLQYKRKCFWTKSLIQECQRIVLKTDESDFHRKVQQAMINDVKSFYTDNKEIVVSVLLTMFNVGSMLSNYETDIAVHDPLALKQLLFNDPTAIVPDPEHTGIPQSEAVNLILELIDVITTLKESQFTFGRLIIVKYYNNRLVADYDDYNYEIRNYLDHILTMSKLSMSSSISVAGRWLTASALYYHKIITGSWLHQIEL